MESRAPAAGPIVAEPIVIGDLRFVPMISAERIAEAVADIAARITERHRDRDPLVVCVLSGAAPLHADLLRLLSFPLEADYLRVESYHGGLDSSGAINFTAEPGTFPAGRNVILVDDIVDTGRTVARLREYYTSRGASIVEVATLLYKREADVIGHTPEYVGIEIENRFVVGYGLDYQGRGRNLPAIYGLERFPAVHEAAPNGAS